MGLVNRSDPAKAGQPAPIKLIYMEKKSEKIQYLLHQDGVTGYCFDKEKSEVRSRNMGIETVIKSGTEEMGRANDSRTGMTLGYGVGEQGKEITKEEYERL